MQYVFLTNSIRNMGGAQMYLRNKLLFLEERGWRVAIFFFNDGDILIPELQRFSSFCIPELRLPVTTISKKRALKVLSRMKELIGNADNCIIETHVYHMSFWAELLAKETKGRNLLCFLHENYPKLSRKEIDYLHFKCDRGELMKSSSWIETRLGQHWKTEKSFKLPSYSNVTTKDEYAFYYDKSLYSILSLGRLDKPYIIPMINEVASFSEKIRKPVNLFLVGGAAEDSFLDDVKHSLDKIKNVIPYFFGYMYPIPENIIRTADVAIATSGAVMVPTELGVPTIAIDAQDYMAIGIYGVTTQNKMRRTKEPQIPIADLLSEVLQNHKYKEILGASSVIEKERNLLLQDHLAIVETIDSPLEFYDVYSIYNKKEMLKQKVVAFLYKFLGENEIGKLSRIVNKVISTK